MAPPNTRAVLHPDIRIHELRIGREQAPLLVIDQFVAGAEDLVALARQREFRPVPRAFPGIRAIAPPDYQKLLIKDLGERLIKYFALDALTLRLSMCHYSLVTLRPNELSPIQRVPHVDSLQHSGLATIHYLFQGNFGGTAFYRHRETGFEFVDESREAEYVRTLKTELAGPDAPGPAYIDGDTALFERISAQPAAWNRMLVYKRNSLHSGSIPPDFVPQADVASGRLSINSFIDAVS